MEKIEMARRVEYIAQKGCDKRLYRRRKRARIWENECLELQIVLG